MTPTNFQFSFTTGKLPNEVFLHLLNPKNWWIGLFGETIEGKSSMINDDFSFSAGGGAHFTRQKLVELLPNRKIVWQVTESELTFLKDQNEWDGTTFGFEILQDNGNTKITFTHTGLTPEIECYDECSTAWTQYLQNLHDDLK